MDYDPNTKTFTRQRSDGFNVNIEDGLISINQDDGNGPSRIVLMPDEASDLVEALRHLIEEHKKEEKPE